MKSVGDNDESPDQLSQSLNLTLDSTEEVGLISSETTSGEFFPLPVSLPVPLPVKRVLISHKMATLQSFLIIDDFRNRSGSFIKTKAKSERSKRTR